MVVPVVHQSRLQWLANADDEPREQAEQDAAQIGRTLPSEHTKSTAGDSDPLVAVKDALRDFDADEVVVVNSPVTEGIALIRAPLVGPSRSARAEQALKTTFCGPYAKAG